jgi:mannose-6-phosphate isomerase-like protein (cupin superfamily)
MSKFYIFCVFNRKYYKNITKILTNLISRTYNETMSEQKTIYHLNNNYEEPLQFGETLLIQIGRRFCETGEVIPTHAHRDWFELTIVTKGTGTIITNGKATQVKGGDIYLSFPCDLHEIHADCNRLEYDFFSLLSFCLMGPSIM